MSCGRCDGDGIVVICPDDMCCGGGKCVHGDGEIACPDCLGDGDLPADDDYCLDDDADNEAP